MRKTYKGLLKYTKGIIRSRNRRTNNTMVKEKEQKENNGQQNTMYYTENERLSITNLTNKLRELVCFGRVDNAYSTS